MDLKKWYKLRNEFKAQFTFNEQAEPVAELHRYRAALEKFLGTAELWDDYVHSTPPADILIKEFTDNTKRPTAK